MDAFNSCPCRICICCQDIFTTVAYKSTKNLFVLIELQCKSISTCIFVSYILPPSTKGCNHEICASQTILTLTKFIVSTIKCYVSNLVLYKKIYFIINLMKLIWSIHYKTFFKGRKNPCINYLS